MPRPIPHPDDTLHSLFYTLSLSLSLVCFTLLTHPSFPRHYSTSLTHSYFIFYITSSMSFRSFSLSHTLLLSTAITDAFLLHSTYILPLHPTTNSVSLHSTVTFPLHLQPSTPATPTFLYSTYTLAFHSRFSHSIQFTFLRSTRHSPCQPPPFPSHSCTLNTLLHSTPPRFPLIHPHHYTSLHYWNENEVYGRDINGSESKRSVERERPGREVETPPTLAPARRGGI